MITNKNPWQSGPRHFTRKQFKFAWAEFRKNRANVEVMSWWMASICLAVEQNRFSPDPLICAQINRGQHAGQSLGVFNA